MSEHELLTDRFEANRARLAAVAYRMLGSRSEAEDAVQEAWLRLSRADTSAVENIGGWLTTVVARVCLDMLRSRKSRGEESLDPVNLENLEPDSTARQDDAADPEREMLLAESIGLALLVVLDALSPAERAAFVLHDMFDLSFDEIAPIVDRSPAAARQLASRARRRVRGLSPAPETDRARRRAVVDAFFAASRDGNFEALLAVLDPDVVLRADPIAVEMAARRGAGAPVLAAEVRGSAAVAKAFAGRARGASPALVNGAPGLVWAPNGEPRAVFGFTVANGKVVGIDLVADPARIRNLDVVIDGA